MSGDLGLAYLVGLPLLGAPVVYLAGRLGRGQRWPARQWAPWWATLAVLGLAWAACLSVPPGASLWAGGIALRFDGLALLVAVLALGLTSLVVVFSALDECGRDDQEKFYALLLVETGAVIGLASATDLFNLWVWFEVMAVVSYVLVAFFREQRASLEASVKYLIQGALGSTLALIGIALVLAQAGTLELDTLRSIAGPSPGLLAAAGLLLVGFGTKAGLVPFHGWLPDAYAQAPGGVSALLSGVVTKLGLVAALRAASALAGVTPTATWSTIFIGLGVVAIALGNLLALRQVQLRRLLAWSSLAHLGYALLGIGIGIYAQQPSSAQGGVFHLLTHAVMSGAAFLAAGALLYSLRERGQAPTLRVSDLAGAARRFPLVALALAVAVLGLGGLPPLAGFMSEWQIFAAGFDTRSPLIVGLVLFAALNTVLSLAYYAPIVTQLYRIQPSETVASARMGRVPASMVVPLVVLSVASVALGVWPTLASPLVGTAAESVVRGFGA